MKDARRSQTRAAIAFVSILAAIGAGFGACTSYQRPNGENCLKDADCLTGYCLAQVCSTPPPTLNGSSYEDGSASEDTGSGAAPDTGTPASDSASSSTPDSSGDSATDGPPALADAGQDSEPSTEDASDGASAADAFDGESATDASETDAGDDAMNDAADSSDSETEDAGEPDGADAINLTYREQLPV